jgi:LmbE family N-acetylglucosaminyl deacetylase
VSRRCETGARARECSARSSALRRNRGRRPLVLSDARMAVPGDSAGIARPSASASHRTTGRCGRAGTGLRPLRRIVVLSPHLDDGIFSVGAAIARWTRSGTAVDVLTPLAGDAQSEVEAEWWDRATGFATHGEAARARRDEDTSACSLVGAKAVWLPFKDATYADRPDPDHVWAELAAAVEGSDAVLVPGFPLQHVDHAWLAQLVLERGLPVKQIGLYVEQPYAFRAWQKRRKRPGTPDLLRPLVPEPVPWSYERSDRRARRAKLRAARAYVSQLPMFGVLPLYRVALYEALHGGEAIAWLSAPASPA